MAEPALEAWSWDAAEIERFGAEVARVIAGYLTGLPGRPVHRGVPWQARNACAIQDAPHAGTPASAILDRFAAEIAPYPFGNGHPRFYGWVNSPPAVIGIFAEALAAAMNPSVAGGDHAAALLERQVVRWLADLAGLPAGAGGLLLSGGSMATLTALAVARNRAMSASGIDVRSAGVGPGPRIVIYATSEAHGCVRKAAELLGIGSANIREIEIDHDFAMRPADLAAVLAADRERGYLQIAVVASAGAVNTGAIDPVLAISDICAESGVWLHVDAAYGGPAVLFSETYREVLAGIGRADSIAIDPHKWLYVPVDAGLLLLREPRHARDTFSLVPPYLRTGADEPWFSEYGFEQTRPFRALKIWMAIQHIGLAGYRELISHDLDLAEYLRDQITLAPDLELLAGGLSVVCFRYLPAGWCGDAAQLDSLNRRVVRAVQLTGRAFIAGTTVAGATALRACVVNPGASRDDIDVLLAEVCGHGARLVGLASPNG